MAPRTLWTLALTTGARRSCGRALAPALTQTRAVSQSHLSKVAAAEKEWNQREIEINEGKREHVWDVLNARGFVKDTAPRPDVIRKVISHKRIGAYVGIDPTAESLHVGHLLPLMPLFWLYFHGMPTTSLIGGATARVGDPTDRLESRKELKNSDIAMNITKIHYQLKKVWANVEQIGRKFGYNGEWAGRPHLRNNNMWMGSLPLYEFLKRLGKDTRIGPMLAKETVKRKMTEGDGMSFAEFTYPLLQGWDWWHMYQKNNIQMQIGGSDQFGNIVAGIEVVKTVRETEPAPHMKMDDGWLQDPVGFTVPLLTDSSGAKFGKSAGNAIWLDHSMTFPFDFYGYFVRRPDDDVERLLRLFTFLPLADISKLMEIHREDPPKRLAQHILAFEVTSIAHGPEVALREQMQHQLMFNKPAVELPEGIVTSATGVKPAAVSPVDALLTDANGAKQKTIDLPESLIFGKSITRILVACHLAASNSEGTRLVQQGGTYVAAQPGQDMRRLKPGMLDWAPVKTWFPSDTQKFVIDGKLLILRRGKYNVRIIRIVSDEEWAASGKRYPGEPYTGRVRRILAALGEDAKSRKQVDEVAEVVERTAAEAEDVIEEGPKDVPFKTVPNNPKLQFPLGPKKGR